MTATRGRRDVALDERGSNAIQARYAGRLRRFDEGATGYRPLLGACCTDFYSGTASRRGEFTAGTLRHLAVLPRPRRQDKLTPPLRQRGGQANERQLQAVLGVCSSEVTAEGRVGN
jgi:hypothetical protein